MQNVKGAAGSVGQAAKDAYNGGAANTAQVRPRLMCLTSVLRHTCQMVPAPVVAVAHPRSPVIATQCVLSEGCSLYSAHAALFTCAIQQPSAAIFHIHAFLQCSMRARRLA